MELLSVYKSIGLEWRRMPRPLTEYLRHSLVAVTMLKIPRNMTCCVARHFPNTDGKFKCLEAGNYGLTPQIEQSSLSKPGHRGYPDMDRSLGRDPGSFFFEELGKNFTSYSFCSFFKQLRLCAIDFDGFSVTIVFRV